MEDADFFQFTIDGDISSIRKAILDGYDINKPDKYGFIPLHRACANHNDEIASLLIQSGSSLNSKGADDWTPIHLASISGAFNCLDSLAKAGIEMDAKDTNGCTALISNKSESTSSTKIN